MKNRKAHYNYEVIDEITSGIVLKGCEVHQLRLNNASINEAYCKIVDGEVWMYESYIHINKQPEFEVVDSKRPRKLLLNKKEIVRLSKSIETKGFTLIPLEVIFNKNTLAKVVIGVCRGKKNYDKRESIKQKDMLRDVNRESKKI